MMVAKLHRRAALGVGLGAATAILAPAALARAPLDVVTTIAQIGEAARRIGGPRVEARSLMGEGVDPHTYRQTRSDVVALGRADMVLHNGLYLEAQLEKLLMQLAERKPVVAVAEAIPAERLLGSPSFPGKFDPHVWMDPDLWAHAVGAVRDALIRTDPDGEAELAANAVSYMADLRRVGAYAAEVLATVPESSRVVVSSHDAFNYFGRAFGYEVMGIQGLSTESEAGLEEVERLVALLVERQIPAVFVETSVSERNVRALVEGAAARGHEVRIGGQLFSDAMGPAGSYTGTYVGMIDSNVTVIARALGGTPPRGGMNGELSEAT
jgi:manganese/zinc/iron transport system substrate-binding protein